MKIIITVIITLAVAVGFVLIALDDPGYVVLARAPYTVRLPMALFALAAMVLFALLYLFFNFLAAVLDIPNRMRKWRQRHNEVSAQLHTMQGYAGLIEGEWAKAEKKLLTHLPYNRAPLLNYLGAAYAAQQRGHLSRRDQYLADARTDHPKQKLAVNLTAARLHYQAGEIAESRDLLEKLRRAAPKNVPVARLLAGVYRQLNDWNSLATLMPALTRLKAFPAEELAAWEQQACERFLSSPALLQGEGRVREAFAELPAARKKDPTVIAEYCRQLLKAGEHELTEKTLRAALNRNWHAPLADLYGKAEIESVDGQVRAVKTWVKKYGEQIDLNLALARLYRRSGKLSLALEAFGEVIAAGREEACAELGALLEETGDTEAAVAYYRRGLAASLANQSSTPDLTPSGELLAQHERSESGEEVMPVVR